MKYLFTGLLITLFTVGINAQSFWINEFHYGNAGTDVGEFVEIVIPDSYTTLASVTVTLYNGTNGAVYDAETANNMTTGVSSDGFTLYTWNPTLIQNGGANSDGFSLDTNGTVILLLSYDGTFTATDGPANGQTSTDVGVVETGGTPVGNSIQLLGDGTDYTDFTWAGEILETPGTLNDNGDQGLPITLMFFNSFAGDGNVTLKWATAAEINNVAFELLRSTTQDGEYTQIAELPGAINSTERIDYQFVDNFVSNSETYWYILVDVDANGHRSAHPPVSATPQSGYIVIPGNSDNLPTAFKLSQNFPNPFNPTTTLSFDIPQTSGAGVKVTLEIFNSLGQKVRTLVKDQEVAAAFGNSVVWDTKSDNGVVVPAGIYFATLKAGIQKHTIKMTLLK